MDTKLAPLSNKPSLTHYFAENQSSDLTHLDLTQYTLYDKENALLFRASALMQAVSGAYNNTTSFKLTGPI